MSFIKELREAIAPEYMRLFNSRIFQLLMSDGQGFEKEEGLELWKIYLWETYHYTKHNGVNQALCVMRTPTTEKKLLKRYLRHGIEEIDHDFLALDDLTNLGVDRETVIKSRPLPETQAFSSLIYDLVIRENPIGRLGYSFWAEGGVNNEQLGIIAQRLRFHFELPDEHMTFVVAHDELDKGHINMVTRAIEEHVHTDAEKEAVMYFGTATAHQYFYFLEGIYDRWERERKVRELAKTKAAK